MEERLDHRAAQLRAQSIADSTKSTYRSQLRTYLAFCNSLNQPPLPVTNTLLFRYVAHLSFKLNYNSVRQYLAVLRLISLESDLPNPLFYNWHLNSILKGFRREVGSNVVKKSPVSPILLLKLRALIRWDNSLDRAIWAACLLMFYGLLRKSNVFPPSAAGFKVGKHLARGDLSVAQRPHPPGLILTLRWSKTLQFRDRAVTCPLPWLGSHPLCPVSAILTACEGAPQREPATPLLWYNVGHIWRPLLYGGFLTRFKALLGLGGFDPNSFAAHSFRRGGASWGFSQGLPGEMIKVMGDWKSPAYLEYIAIPLESKFKAIHQFAKGLPTSY